MERKSMSKIYNFYDWWWTSADICTTFGNLSNIVLKPSWFKRHFVTKHALSRWNVVSLAEIRWGKRPKTIRTVTRHCAIGWGSTYDMLKRLLDLSSFCKDSERLNDKLKLTEEGWKELQEVVGSLAPVRTLTTKLQESALTSGQSLGYWQLTMLSLDKFLLH